jgi:hypothetical protein
MEMEGNKESKYRQLFPELLFIKWMTDFMELNPSWAATSRTDTQ